MTGVLSRLQWEKRDSELCWVFTGNKPVEQGKPPMFTNADPERILAALSPMFPKKDYRWRLTIYEPTGRSRGPGSKAKGGVIISRRWKRFVGPPDPNMKLYGFYDALELWLAHVRMIRSQV